MKKFPFATMLMLVSFAVLAQSGQGNGGCPGGMVPGYGKCYSPTDPDRFGAGQGSQTPDYSGPLWQDRYGAIASDDKTGSIGWASNARSKKEASKAAIEDCGGGGCKAESWVRNGCLAVSWGGGIASYMAGQSLAEAEARSMDKCKNNGRGAACKLEYSACSLPVRIR